ncbi:hypothetical protein SAMN04487949_1275 [Halogranum gelatinilyticum]|uniref:Uncharacterized protein n=1 Tax=Halogranum gelatinilyticum TaxID=660521 RepID=A0A1G9RCY5_9EURY|nr:hypothetical protein [Halogranum gelatinilyticum]SDM20727.1 hypothetical protein SAMN04487949_1275 [Halogranum gelatinilyticum]
MALAIDFARFLLLGLVVGLVGTVARDGLSALSRRTLVGWCGLVIVLVGFLLVTSPRELRDTGLQLVVVLFLATAFWVYYDGLERLGNLEASLWALVVLCLGGLSLFSVGYTVAAVVATAGYVVRTRVVSGTSDPAA